MKDSRWTGVFMVLGLMFSLMSAARADSAPKVIVVVTRAAWCSVCKTHGDRAGKVVMAAVADGALKLVVNDVTNDDTTKASQAALVAAGVDQAMAPYTATGVLYFFDAHTKRPLRQITVANTDQEIKQVIELARRQASR